MNKETSGCSVINDNGVKHTIPSGIVDAEYPAVAVLTSSEPYGPPTKWRQPTPEDGTHLVALLPQDFIGRNTTSNTAGDSSSGPNVVASGAAIVKPEARDKQNSARTSRDGRWTVWKKVVEKWLWRALVWVILEILGILLEIIMCRILTMML